LIFSELIFEHYFTIIKTKNHWLPGLIFDKMKYSFAGRTLQYFFKHYVQFEKWTCLHLIFEQSIV